MKILSTIFKITIIVINFYPDLLFGQDSENLIWKNCAEIKNPDVTAYALFDTSGRFEKNALIYRRRGNTDTINLEYSMTPGFINNCQLEKFQLDGNGTKEIIITYGNSTKTYTSDLLSSIEKSYTIKQIWNIDTQKRLMIFTTNYYYLQITPIYGGSFVKEGKVYATPTGFERDSCIYKLKFSISKKHIIKIEKIEEIEKCYNNCLFTINEGYYYFKKGKLTYKSFSEEETQF